MDEGKEVREGLMDGCMTQCEPIAALEEQLRSGSVTMTYKAQHLFLEAERSLLISKLRQVLVYSRSETSKNESRNRKPYSLTLLHLKSTFSELCKKDQELIFGKRNEGRELNLRSVAVCHGN